jgi:hypothetical protein
MYRSMIPVLAGAMLLGSTVAKAELATPARQQSVPTIRFAVADAPAFEDVIEVSHTRGHTLRKGQRRGRLVASMRRHTILRVQQRASYTSPPVSPAEDRNPMTRVERVPLGR